MRVSGRVAPSLAVVTPGHHRMVISTPWGTEDFSGATRVQDALGHLAGVTCWTNGSLGAFATTTDPKEWVMDVWRSCPTSIIHQPTGVVVTSLREAVPSGEESGCFVLADWLHSHGIPLGSFSSMAKASFLRSLYRPVTFYSDPEISRGAFYGGRQECRRPGRFQHMRLWDMTAAYPTAMAVRPVAAGLRKVPVTTTIDPDVPGLADATVWVDRDVSFGPLPLRLGDHAICFPQGKFQGRWTWTEIAAAVATGAEVTIESAWAPSKLVDPFTPWWEMMAPVRKLAGVAGVLGKVITNSLWGLFAMRGDERERWTWPTGNLSTPQRSVLAPMPLPYSHTVHVAAEISSRVRVELLRGIHDDRSSYPVHVDTDGIICRSTRQPPRGSSWRLKKTMTSVEIRAPQLYRYDCGSGCGITHPRWHYCASGITEKRAPFIFERTRPSLVSIEHVWDRVVPRIDAEDLEAIGEYLAQITATEMEDA